MLLDIVILPPKKLRRKIGKAIKKAVGGRPAGFIVDGKKLIPHLSLWHLNTLKDRIGKIEKELRRIVKSQESFILSSTEFAFSKMRSGIVGSFNIRKSKQLASLRQKIFKNTHRLKTKMMPEFKPFGVWTGKSLKEARKYGRPVDFHPHFTMVWLKNEKDALVVKNIMDRTKFRFVAKEIYICEVNKWWQVTRIISKINL